MRRVKKQFRYTKVVGTDPEGTVVINKNYTGKVDASKVMKDYLKDNEYQPLELELEEVTETRVLSGEDFIKYSTIIEDDTDNDDEDEE